MAAAHDQIAEDGYASASVVAVAHRAGVATGNVYRYFPSKAELFVEVFRRAANRELELIAEIVDRPGPVRSAWPPGSRPSPAVRWPRRPWSTR